MSPEKNRVKMAMIKIEPAPEGTLLMGHNSIKTTGHYTHVTERGMQKVKSPLDNIKLKKG